MFRTTSLLGFLLLLTINLGAPSALAVNRALSLDGDGDLLEVRDVQFSYQALTLEAWVYNMNDSDEYREIIGTPDSYNFELQSLDGENIMFYAVPERASALSGDDAFQLKIWHHIAGVYDGTTFTIYVDGQPVGQSNATGSADIVDATISIGSDGLSEFWYGLLDEVRIWNIARTQEEIQAAMNQPLENPQSIPNLVGYWNFDDGTSNDSSPYGNHGTLMGDANIIPLHGTWPPSGKDVTLVTGNIGVCVELSQWYKLFVNIVKNARPFQEFESDELVPMDDLGWPLTDAKLILLESWPATEWWNEIDDPEEYHTDLSGTYKCSFNGQATLNYVWGDFTISNQQYDEGSNTTTFDLNIGEPGPGKNNGLVHLTFTDTKRTPSSPPNSGITNLKAIRPGYDPNTTQIFHDEFLNALNSANFSTIRFGGFTMTGWVGNHPEYPNVVEWSDRRPVEVATYHENPYISSEYGAPWEMVIELGNITDKDIWINVPVAATDDYIHQLATLIRDNLKPELKVYVEYSNEVWNFGGDFTQSHWNIANAEKQGLSHIEGYAKRTAEIALIFQDVFGGDSLNNRVRVVNCWQIGGWIPQYNEQMEYINVTFGPPKNLIYGLGVAPYFNCEGACNYGNVQEILDQMWKNSDKSKLSRKKVYDIATKWELPGGLLAYEGGSDTGGGSTVNIKNRILTERSPGMKDVIIHDLLDNWFPVGGGLFMYYQLVRPYNRWGSWGLTDEVGNPDRNYKFAAIRELVGGNPVYDVSSRKQTVTLSLHKGINFISIPLKSKYDWRLSDIARHIGDVSMIVFYNHEEDKFTAYLPESTPEDAKSNVPVKCGEGYIVLLTVDKDVAFSGYPCGDDVIAAPSFSLPILFNNGQKTSIFTVTGSVIQETGELLNGVSVKIRNKRTGKILEDTTGAWAGSGRYVVTFAGSSSNSVTQSGDELEITVEDPTNKFTPSPITHTLTAEEISELALFMPHLRLLSFPKQSGLLQNFPNPFNPETWMPYQLATDSPVTISIYNFNGQLIRTISLENQNAGIYTTKAKAAHWDGRDILGERVASGVYFYTLQADNFRATRKMVILK